MKKISISNLYGSNEKTKNVRILHFILDVVQTDHMKWLPFILHLVHIMHGIKYGKKK